MSSTITSVLLLISLTISSPLYAGERALRPTGGAAIWSAEDDLPNHDNGRRDTLDYDHGDNLIYFMTAPNEFDEIHLSVRFTPTFAPYHIDAALIPLFGWVFMGRPGMRVTVWQTNAHPDSIGLPGEPIDSLSFPFDSLLFGDADNIIPNIIDLTPLDISIGRTDADLVDFHISVDRISESGRDSLGIYFSAAEEDTIPEDNDRRSITWSPGDEEWVVMSDAYGFPVIFAIRAVISNDTLGLRDTLDIAGPPALYALDPAYPNPFNSTATVRYFVANGRPFSIDLLDPMGRTITQLAEGRGQNNSRVSIDARSLPAGVYLLRLESVDGIQVQRLVLQR